MKKLLTTIALMLAALAVNAQGTWEKHVIEADELTNEEEGAAYIFTDPKMGAFVFWGFDTYQFRLTSDAGQFDIDSYGVEVIVGLYDGEGKLEEKFNMWLDYERSTANRYVRTRNAGGFNNPIGQKAKVKKIFAHLKSGEGYVRIVAPRYNKTNFDLKILPFDDK